MCIDWESQWSRCRLTVVLMLENWMGLLIPRTLSSDGEKVMVSLSRSMVLRTGVRQESFPAALTQKSNLLSHMAVGELSQWPPSQSSWVGLL